MNYLVDIPTWVLYIRLTVIVFKINLLNTPPFTHCSFSIPHRRWNQQHLSSCPSLKLENQLWLLPLPWPSFQFITKSCRRKYLKYLLTLSSMLQVLQMHKVQEYLSFYITKHCPYVFINCILFFSKWAVFLIAYFSKLLFLHFPCII